MVKIKRQGLVVTLGQLIKISNDLLKEEMEFQRSLGFKDEPINYGKEFQINIINKIPECSDTWRIE